MVKPTGASDTRPGGGKAWFIPGAGKRLKLLVLLTRWQNGEFAPESIFGRKTNDEPLGISLGAYFFWKNL